MANVHMTTSNWSEYVYQALDLATRVALRDEPMFRNFVDVRPEKPAHPGSPVRLTIDGEAPRSTTPLSETADVEAVASGDPRFVDITPAEYGQVLGGTNKLRHLDFTAATMVRLGGQLAHSMQMSLDDIVRAVFDGGENVIHSTDPATFGSLTGPADSVMNSKNVIAGATLLQGRRAKPKFGANWAGLIHPHVSFDLRTETGDTGWLKPNMYSGNVLNIFNGELGVFGRTRWIETPTCTVTAGTPDLYTTYLIGQEAVAEVTVEDFHPVVAPQTDNLKRFHRVGWLGFAGWGRFRENALQLISSTASLEALATAWDPQA